MTDEREPQDDGQGDSQPAGDETLALEYAQLTIMQALRDVHASRIVVDGQEKNPPTYEEARNKLRFALQTMPKEVSSVSVKGAFKRLKTPEERENYPGWLGSSLLALQQLLDKVNPDSVGDENVPFELTVRPNYYPDELRTLHFGSRARDLETEVRETMTVRYDFGLHYLDVKPYGDSPSDFSHMSAKPFRVPLQIVQAIELHREQKPLSPYLEGRNPEDLQLVPVQYA